MAEEKSQVLEGERNLEDFALGKGCGHGSFCTVVLCTDKIGGGQYAMKDVHKKKGPSDQACVMEAHCLRRLADSPLVINLFWEFDAPTRWVGILEFCEGGELWERVKGSGCCSEQEVAWFAAQAIRALAVVHEAGIVHRDVKCENFLVSDQTGRILKLIDFGTARDLNHPEVKPMILGPQYEHHVGTPNFMAPEVVHGKANDRRSDLWSLGCTIYQTALGMPPFDAATPFLILNKAQNRDMWFPAQFDSTLKELVDTLTQIEAETRLGAADGTLNVLEHPFFAAGVSAPPEYTLLQQGLECVGRAVADEVLADLAEEERKKVAENEDMCVTIVGALKPGEATSKLMNELPGIVGQSADVGCGALLAWAQSIAAGPGFSNLPTDPVSACSSGSSLTEACKCHLIRFAEQGNHKRASANEDPFAGSDDSDEDEDEGSSNASYNEG